MIVLKIFNTLIRGVIGLCFGFVVSWAIFLLIGSIFPGFLIPTLGFIYEFILLFFLAFCISIVSAAVFIGLNRPWITIAGLIITLILASSWHHRVRNMPQNGLIADKYLKQALTNLDSNICQKIELPYQNQECYFKIAIRTGDKDLCKNLTDQKTLNNCIIIIDSDIEKCRKISDHDYLYKDECLAGIAVVTKNHNICHELTAAGYRDECYRDLGAQQNP